MNTLTLSNTIIQIFPYASDCIDGHIGPTIYTWYEEIDDDRVNLLKVPRCGHCGIPNGADVYASEEDRKLFLAGKEPSHEEI